jgi:hypothetical protein
MRAIFDALLIVMMFPTCFVCSYSLGDLCHIPPEIASAARLGFWPSPTDFPLRIIPP